MSGGTPPRSDEPDDENWLPELMRQVGAALAAREAESPAPAPPPEPEPWVDKPGALMAAERDVFRLELSERLRRLLCGDAARCKRQRCRRRRRCSAVEEIARDLAAARARLAAERAKWQPPLAPPAAPRGRRKR
jgi:hypothetical protein